MQVTKAFVAASTITAATLLGVAGGAVPQAGAAPAAPTLSAGAPAGHGPEPATSPAGEGPAARAVPVVPSIPGPSACGLMGPTRRRQRFAAPRA